MLALAQIMMVLACTPNPMMRCSRAFVPVCANGVDYTNVCQAQAAGYVGACARNISSGTCSHASVPRTPAGLSCPSTQTYSETGRCVPRPWRDFHSCLEEKRQGACADGNDPNPWVVQHCMLTCTVG